jgi:shikimate kinase
MGAGKTTTGKQLTTALQMNFVDLDHFIENSHGTSITDIFLDNGEDYFRMLEQRYLEKLTHYTHTIIACGGGTPCFHNNMHLIKQSGLVVYIKQPVHVLYNRLVQQQMQRPLLMGMDEQQLLQFITTNLQRREAYYYQAHIIYEPDKETLTELINKITLFYKSS